jgi:hypothetical protein
LGVEADTKICGVQQNIGLVLTLLSSKDVWNLWSCWRVSMKGPIEIEQYSSLISIRLFRDKITIK